MYENEEVAGGISTGHQPLPVDISTLHKSAFAVPVQALQAQPAFVFSPTFAWTGPVTDIFNYTANNLSICMDFPANTAANRVVWRAQPVGGEK